MAALVLEPGSCQGLVLNYLCSDCHGKNGGEGGRSLPYGGVSRKIGSGLNAEVQE